MGKGPGIIEFFARFPNEDACLDQVVAVKWGSASPCPGCGEAGTWKKIAGTKKWRHSCHRQFSPLKDTVFYRSNLSLMAWFYALFLFTNASTGMRISFIRKQLGLGHNGSVTVCRRIRVHMAAMARPEMLGGPGKTVHIDEALLRFITNPDGRKHDTAIVLGMACEGQVICGIVPDRKATTVRPAILARVRPGSKVVTDMHLAYRGLERHGYHHVRINHSVAFHDFKGNSSSAIESYWASVKRVLRAYRQVSRENLWTYLAEIEFQYNRRHARHLVFDELVAHFPPHDPGQEAVWRSRFEWAPLHRPAACDA